MRILLVDDDEAGRELLADYLSEQLGHEVTQSCDGMEALEEYDKNPYPMVITDIQMPRLDGLNLLTRLKSTPDGQRSDIVLITGFGDMKMKQKLVVIGNVNFAIQPANSNVGEIAARNGHGQGVGIGITKSVINLDTIVVGVHDKDVAAVGSHPHRKIEVAGISAGNGRCPQRHNMCNRERVRNIKNLDAMVG